MATRKRAAPGASPQAQQQPNMQNSIFPQESGNISADQYMNDWNSSSIGGEIDPAFNPSYYGDYTGNLAGGTNQSSHNRIVSLDGLNNGNADNQLVRRNPNQQLTAPGRTAWDYDDGQQSGWENADNEDDELEQKALMARKDAQTKRKQIPPFVQKLSSFLDDNKNTNLIRWSDDGKSFIVLDEDEFARTLIPELFKHNNYASFVRQLNMYGFHKKVGLSDNSMKASETKAKAPSEYYNKYFRRGRSELLWLIQKPKNPTSGPKRKRDDDKQGDSDEDRKYIPDTGGGGYGEDGLAVRPNQEMAMIPRQEYNSLRTEVRALQQQQKVISNVLSQIRRQNDQLYQQATAFQTLHERHENSINAILTFLATFYNRTLEGGNVPNIADMFGPTVAQQKAHGSVVDVGELPEKSFEQPQQMQRQGRRPLALLPAPATKDGLASTDHASTLNPAVPSTGGSPISKSPSWQAAFRSPATQTKNTPGSAGFGNQQSNATAPTNQTKGERPSGSQPTGPLPENDEIMSAIQNVNANLGQSSTQGPQLNFPEALANFQSQGGNMPLTQQQRDDVLSLMANNASAASPNSALAQNSNNAVVSPQPPALPDLSQFQDTQAQLNYLQKISDNTTSRVQNLQERLQPLSPSGSIPGLNNDSYFSLGDPGAFDLNDFTRDGDFFTQNAQDGTFGTADVPLPDAPTFDLADAFQDPDGPNFDTTTGNHDLLNVDGANDEGHRIESVSSSAPSPAVTVEDVDEEKPEPTPKRRKK